MNNIIQEYSILPPKKGPFCPIVGRPCGAWTSIPLGDTAGDCWPVRHRLYTSLSCLLARLCIRFIDASTFAALCILERERTKQTKKRKKMLKTILWLSLLVLTTFDNVDSTRNTVHNKSPSTMVSSGTTVNCTEATIRFFRILPQGLPAIVKWTFLFFFRSFLCSRKMFNFFI